MSLPRIYLIHATPLAVAAINDSMKRMWPQARACNLLDDSLPADLQSAGKIDAALTERFVKLGRYAFDAGADGIIFTCSAFGPAIDACKAALPIPVLRPNEAMLAEALGHGDRVALMASFAPAIAPITAELHACAASLGRKVSVVPVFVEGALAAAQAGDAARHDRLLAEAAAAAADADVIGFAQFSMSSAAEACAAAAGKPVLTTPDSAVRLLQKRLAAAR